MLIARRVSCVLPCPFLLEFGFHHKRETPHPYRLSISIVPTPNGGHAPAASRFVCLVRVAGTYTNMEHPLILSSVGRVSRGHNMSQLPAETQRGGAANAQEFASARHWCLGEDHSVGFFPQKKGGVWSQTTASIRFISRLIALNQMPHDGPSVKTS